jgi:muconolactone delta-isomerase
MLFLVLDEVKIAFVQPEVSLAQITMLKQTFELYEEMKSKGKLKFCYAFADFPGGVCIWDVESNEELQHILFLLPSMPLVKRTVRPLTEMKSVSEIINELESLVSSMPKQSSN